MNRPRRFFVFAMFACLFLTFSATSFADILTGHSTRVKSIGPFTANVYAIDHFMKEKPSAKSKQAVIDAAMDKRFVLTMMRDVLTEKIQKALRDAFAMNGFGDTGRINTFVGAFSQKEIAEKSSVVISYNAAAKTTTIKVDGGKTETIAGEDFMKAVWSIWFGKIDQPALGDQLIAKL